MSQDAYCQPQDDRCVVALASFASFDAVTSGRSVLRRMIEGWASFNQRLLTISHAAIRASGRVGGGNRESTLRSS
jgi:hypothetical protein